MTPVGPDRSGRLWLGKVGPGAAYDSRLRGAKEPYGRAGDRDCQGLEDLESRQAGNGESTANRKPPRRSTVYTSPCMANAAATTAPDAPVLDKSGQTIRDMFAGVAPRYDLLNHVLSASLDYVWRRRAAAALGAPAGSPVLDLCCGTGDQATALKRGGARVAAADFCIPMLALARKKFARLAAPRPGALAADALALPFPTRHFQGATVSFGLR